MVWFAPPEEGWSPPEEANQEAPMPGHLIQGGNTRRVIPRGIPDRGIPHTHATATPARNAYVETGGPGWVYDEDGIEGSDGNQLSVAVCFLS